MAETSLHESALSKAMIAAKTGEIDHGEWTAPPDSERNQDDCVGSEKSYPVMSGGKVSAKGVASALGYARTNAPSLVPHLEKLDEAVNAHQQHASVQTIYLSIPSDFKPAVTLGTNGTLMPKTVGGVPAFYFWKEVVTPGEFTGWITTNLGPVRSTFPFSRERIKNLCDTGKRYLAAGRKIGINLDHKDGAKNSLGFVIDMRLSRGGGLEELCQFIGEDSRDTAMRNQVSIEAKPNYTDPSGTHWGDTPTGLAVTDEPACPVQDDYKQAASQLPADVATRAVFTLSASAPTRSTIMDGLPYTEEHMNSLKSHAHLKMKDVPDDKAIEHLSKFHATHAQNLSEMCGCLPDADGIDPSEIMPLALQYLSTMKGVTHKLGLSRLAAGDAGRQQLMARIDTLSNASDQLTQKDNAIKERDNQIQNLSSRVVKELDPDSEQMVVDAVGMRLNALAEAGIAPHVVQALRAEFLHDGKKANTIMLSKAASLGNKAPIIRLLEILETNKGFVSPEFGGRQNLTAVARVAPGGAGPSEADIKAGSDAFTKAMCN